MGYSSRLSYNLLVIEWQGLLLRALPTQPLRQRRRQRQRTHRLLRRIGPFQNAWVRAAIPLEYFRKPAREGFDLAATSTNTAIPTGSTSTSAAGRPAKPSAPSAFRWMNPIRWESSHARNRLRPIRQPRSTHQRFRSHLPHSRNPLHQTCQRRSWRRRPRTQNS